MVVPCHWANDFVQGQGYVPWLGDDCILDVCVWKEARARANASATGYAHEKSNASDMILLGIESEILNKSVIVFEPVCRQNCDCPFVAS